MYRTTKVEISMASLISSILAPLRTLSFVHLMGLCALLPAIASGETDVDTSSPSAAKVIDCSNPEFDCQFSNQLDTDSDTEQPQTKATSSSETETPLLHKRTDFYIAGGIALVHFNTNLQVTKDNAPLPVYLGFEGNFGLPATNHVNALFGAWNINDQHRISFQYFGIDRSSEVFAEEITWQGNVLGNVSVGLRDKTNFTEVAYGYTLHMNDHTRITGELGLFALDMSITATAKGNLKIASVFDESVSYTEGFDVTAPLPMIGLGFLNQLSEKWSMNARVHAIAGKYDEVGAVLYRTRLAGRYAATKRFGLSAGVDYFDARVVVEEEDRDYDLNYGYTGVYLGLDYKF